MDVADNRPLHYAMLAARAIKPLFADSRFSRQSQGRTIAKTRSVERCHHMIPLVTMIER